MESKEERIESGLRQKAGRLVRRVAGAVKTAAIEAVPTPKRIPPEEINEEAVAKIIYTQLRNRFQGALKGDEWANGFTIVDVLANIGYVGITSNTDYYQKFPEPYRAARNTLQRLVHEGVLKTATFDEVDINGERLIYKMVDETKLRQIAQIKDSA